MLQAKPKIEDDAATKIIYISRRPFCGRVKYNFLFYYKYSNATRIRANNETE